MKMSEKDEAITKKVSEMTMDAMKFVKDLKPDDAEAFLSTLVSSLSGGISTKTLVWLIESIKMDRLENAREFLNIVPKGDYIG